MRISYLFATFFVILTTAPMISQGSDIQFPCDHWLRDHLPELFAHCTLTSCTYSDWSSWSATGVGKIAASCSTRYAEQFNRTKTGSSECPGMQYQTKHRCSAIPFRNRTQEQVAKSVVDNLGMGALPTTTNLPGNSTARGKRLSDFDNKRLVHPSLSRHRRQCEPKNTSRYFVIVLDTSGSIGATLFKEQKDYLATVVQSLCGSIEVAMITYSSAPKKIFCFKGDKKDAANEIRAAKYMGLSTQTDKALEFVESTILKSDCGWPSPPANDERNLNIITLTDGMHSSRSLPLIPPIVQRLGGKTANTELYAIAFGNVDETGIQILVKSPDTNHIFNIPAFDNQTRIESDYAATLPNICLGYHGDACNA